MALNSSSCAFRPNVPNGGATCPRWASPRRCARATRVRCYASAPSPASFPSCALLLVDARHEPAVDLRHHNCPPKGCWPILHRVQLPAPLTTSCRCSNCDASRGGSGDLSASSSFGKAMFAYISKIATRFFGPSSARVPDTAVNFDSLYDE
jgi:hypothetical protein